MRYNFTKMQSLGNDFVMLNGIAEDIRIDKGIARFIADRNFGIGCDQIIVAELGSSGVGFRMRIFNSDGSEVGQCGNGARCFAQFLHDQSLTSEKVICVETMTTEMELAINVDQTVTAKLSKPIFEAEKIPLALADSDDKYQIETSMGGVEFNAISMGNPHCVIAVDDVDTAKVATLGPIVETHAAFPERINVGFSEFVSPTEIKLRVHERGAGETLGCGSGACAAVVAGIENGELESSVDVVLPGGRINVVWEGADFPVLLRGSTHHVFQSEIDIPKCSQ